ncbi:MAG: patatin-like phospholipase family protein [Bacteroidetes bacterium]|nr:patatin-like phospholipase family protein [Bacteroidota bacterium]
MSTQHQFKILSLDGGGIRGVIPCRILEFIEQQTRPVGNVFDLIAGTSTGGIIALGLSKPDADGRNAYSASDMLDLYQDFGKVIFKKRKGKGWINGFISSFSDTLDTVTDQVFDPAGLEKQLLERFGDTRLREAITQVLITTYEIQKGKTFYFQSRLAHTSEAENLLMREIARSTSAAPTYFTPSVVKVEGKDQGFVDGGVFANNPSVLAYGEAKELWKRRQGTLGFEPDVLPDDNDLPFFMLSIGTGDSSDSIPLEEAKKWDTGDWIKPLLDSVFMRSVSESTHFTMQHLLPKYTDQTPRYVRLNPPIPKKHAEMSDASDENIQALIAIADEYIEQNKKDLLTICEYLRN